MSDYIGKRIVPRHCGEWDGAKGYEMLSIVLHTASGESYISRREVPAGTDITDGEYWAVCSRFSQQVRDMEEHLQETESRMAEDLHNTKEAMSGELAQTGRFLTEKVAAADEDLRQGRAEMNDNIDLLKREIEGLIGAGTADTELLDIRMDAEGDNHTTAGEAVRSIADGLVPKILPAEVNVAVDKNYGNTARIELKGRTVRGVFSYVGASYVGLFASFFGDYDAIKGKKYRVVIRSEDEIPDISALVTNAKRAWGSMDGTVSSITLKRAPMNAQNHRRMVVDIDFSEPRWEEFVEKYTAGRTLHFALRVETKTPIPAATVTFYAYERTDLHDTFWKYVSEHERVSLLEQEIADGRNDGEAFASLGDVIRYHGSAARELEQARTDSRGVAFGSLPERLDNMDALMRPRLPMDRLIRPRDNVNIRLESEDGFMGGEVTRGNAVYRFCYSGYLAYEIPHWGSLNFSFSTNYENMMQLKHLDSLYLDIRLECPENPELHAGEAVDIFYYINGYDSWGKTVNKMLTKPVVIGHRNLIPLEEEQVRNVLAQNLPLCIVFAGSFLKPDIFKDMDHVRMIASVIDRSQMDGLYAYTGYADTAETALFAHQAETANHAVQADRAQNASHSNSAETASMADNFFLNAPKGLLNLKGKRYSPGMDTLEVPEKSPYTMNGGFQTVAEGRELVREDGGFSDILHFHMPLSNGVSQTNNQGYIKNLSGLMAFDELLEKFEAGYPYGFVCALEDCEGYPEESRDGSHCQNLLIAGYPDGATLKQFVSVRNPAVRRVSDSMVLSVWRFQIKAEDIASIRAGQEAGTYRMGWYGVWNTRAYTLEEPASWDASWYWSDLAFTDGAYSDEDMLTYFFNKYSYWASLVNHPALKRRFQGLEERVKSLAPQEGVDALGLEVDKIKKAIGTEKEIHITCWGDSLTAGGGWTTTLAKLSGAVVHNGGTGGENARTIAARQGADVMMVSDITIPAACEPVTIAERETDTGITTAEGNKVTPLLQGGAHVNPVDIGGVLGTLRWTGTNYADKTGIWTFTRSEPGEAVAITRPTAIRTAFDRERNGADEMMVIFIGQNGGYKDIPDLIRMHRLMIDHCKGKEYVVLGLSSGTAAQRKNYEDAMKEAFGRRFISLREYLAHPIYDTDGTTVISCYGLDDAGLDATDADIERIKIGQVPQTLLSDSVHYTAATKTVIGTMLYKKMAELGILK
ncbi:MAG: hypothetical protein Q4F81_12615 [Eubacteriales bacterium]|nr:hypothetical protein [Eubacteriales bacterium]